MIEVLKILVADELSPRGVEILRAAHFDVTVKTGLKGPELAAALRGVHALVVRSATKVTPEALAGADSLQVIGRAGIGVDNVDVPAASRKGVVVMNTPGGNAVTAAEHAIALLCALARRIPQATASVKAGKWEKGKFKGVELADKTLGVIGLGNIGRIVADRGHGLRMRVVGHDPFLAPEAAAKLGVPLVSLDELLARADAVTIHVPLTPETRGLLGADRLRRMKPGALLVNAARGGIVDEAALHEALAAGRLGGAALDVFATEPPGQSPLLALDNVIASPHLGASTEEAQERVSVEIAEQVVAFLLRGELRNAVNAAALPADGAEPLRPYVALAGRLGALLGQLAGGAIESVEVEILGAALEPGAKPAGAAALAAFLRTHVEGPVNEVNAPLVASERGVRFGVAHRSSAGDCVVGIGISASGPGWSHRVRGTLVPYGETLEPALTSLDDFALQVRLGTHHLLLRNEDRPGVIGAVGTVFGRHGINVSELRVALSSDRREALQLWNIEQAPTDAALQEIRGLPGVRGAQHLAL
ncbi:MAG: phosphoglycerate dehydrogenase [Deltaproteobacteria bacterium]|nr:phosphoglycerate dehydrogenase [Deltaproteobacteria bacterium]